MDNRESVPPSARFSFVPKPPERPTVTARALGLFDHFGTITDLTLRTVRALFKRPFETKAIILQLESLGVRSLGIVAVTSIFIGMVMAVQFAIGLRKFCGM